MFENQTDNQHSDQHFFLIGFIIEEMQPNYPAYLKKFLFYYCDGFPKSNLCSVFTPPWLDYNINQVNSPGMSRRWCFYYFILDILRSGDDTKLRTSSQ